MAIAAVHPDEKIKDSINRKGILDGAYAGASQLSYIYPTVCPFPLALVSTGTFFFFFLVSWIFFMIWPKNKLK